MYKLNVNKEDIRKFDKEALICELGFYIGTKKEIDEYIKKNILGIEHNADEYFVFYMFCKFVVEKFFDSGVQDIYELIDYNYIRLVGMFLNEKCEVVMEEKNNDLLDKINDIANEKEYKQNMQDTENVRIILNTYKNLKPMFEKFEKNIELMQVGVSRGVLKFDGNVYDTELYKKFSANCISHSTGFVRLNSYNDKVTKFGLGKFGGGCCGEVGILYKNGKLYLTTSNWHNEILLELNDETTEDDILNCEKVKNDLGKFAEYCDSFSKNISEKLDNFEEYIRNI